MSLAENLSDDDLDAIADALQDHGDFYTRRQIIAAAAATGSLGGMLGLLGVDDASAGDNQTGTVGGPQDWGVEDVFMTEMSTLATPDSGEETLGMRNDGLHRKDPSGTVKKVLSDGEDFDGQGTSSFTGIESFDTDELNNVKTPAPGDVQAAIDELDADPEIGYDNGKKWGEVVLRPGEIYDPGAEIHLKPGIALYGSEAVFKPSSDHNILFADNATRFDIRADTDASFTSDVVVLDAARSTNGNYSAGVSGSDRLGASRGTVKMIGDLDTAPSTETEGGVALALRASTEGSVSSGNRFHVEAYRPGTGVLCDASGGFVNPDRITGTIETAHTHIKHQGDDNAQTTFDGTFQISASTEYGIRNTTSNPSVTFRGQFWDPFNAGTYALAGPHILVKSEVGASISLSDGDGAPGQRWILWDDGSKFVYDFEYGNEIEWEYIGGGIRVHINGTELLRFDETRLFMQQSVNLNGHEITSFPEFDQNSDAASNSIFYHTGDSVLKYRDPSGTVNALY